MPKFLQEEQPEIDEASGVTCFPYMPERKTPYLLSTTLILPFLSLSGHLTMEGMRRGQSENTPLGCMLKNFKKGFNGHYRVKLTPGQLKNVCEIDWSGFGVEWASEGSLDKVIVNKVFEVVVGVPGHQDQFPYISCWQDAVLSRPMWLKPHLEEACRVMVASMAAASKCREDCKKPEKPTLVGDPGETPPPYVPLYPLLHGKV
jgi:hypothetical protein